MTGRLDTVSKGFNNLLARIIHPVARGGWREEYKSLVSCMIWVLGPDRSKPRGFTPAMTEATEILPGLPAVKGKPVPVACDGGRLTSDAGILLLSAIEQRLKIAERLAACLEDPRDPERVRHELAEIDPPPRPADCGGLSRR
jgi:hypothetical protein